MPQRLSKPALVGLAMLICTSCEQRGSGVDANSGSQAAPNLGAWSDQDSLPLLVRRPISPVIDEAEFEVQHGEYTFPKASQQRPPTDEPFPTDDLAIAAARSWIEKYFGRLPPGVSLEVSSIDHSASGNPQPVYDWDRGHTVCFREHFRAIPTDAFAVVYITGRSRFSATVGLCDYEAVPGSERKLVSKELAVGQWRQVIEPQGPEALAAFDRRASARLVYVWSPIANESAGEKKVIAPTWVLDDEELVMVDGHTGKAWHND